jgi:hypothetical protein
MSESPELLNLSIDIETADANSKFDELIARIEKFQGVAFEAFGKGDESAYDFVNALIAIKDASFSTTANIEEMGKQVDQLAANYENLGKVVDQVNAAYDKNAEINRMAIGYGSSGGMIGPEAPPEAGDSGIGSLYSVGRGLSAAGGITGVPAIRDVGGLIYIEEALRKLSDVVPALNAAIEGTPSLLTPIISGFAEMGIPLAGLTAVVVGFGAVAAPAIALIAAAQNQYNQQVELGRGIIEQATAGLPAYYKAVITGTTESTAKEIEAKQTQNQIDLATLNDYTQKRQALLDKGPEWGALDPTSISNAIAQWQGQVDDLTKKIDPLITKTLETTNDLVGLGNAIGSTGVAANDAQAAAEKAAAEAARSGIANAQHDADIKRQYAADDALSLDAANKRLEMLRNDIPVLQAQQAALLPLIATSKDAAAQYAELGVKIKDEANEGSHLIYVSTPLIVARQNEANEITATNAALATRNSFLEQEGRLLATGTPQQVASLRGNLAGRLLGDQMSLADLEAKPTRTADEDKQVEKFKADIVEDKRELADLDVIGPIIDAKQAFVDLGKSMEAFDKKRKTLEDNLAVQSEATRQRETNAEQQYTRGSLQDVEARFKIAQDESRKELELAQDTANRLEDIQTKKANKEMDLAVDLGRQLTDDVVKFNDSRAKLIRNEQDQEAEDAVALQERLKEVSRTSKVDITQALLDRNFLEINQQKARQQAAADNEAQSDTARVAKQRRSLENAERELEISLSQQQRDQGIAYQRKYTDAELAAQREIQQTATTEDRKRTVLLSREQQQIEDLNRNETYRIQLLRQGMANELALLKSQEEQRLKILEAAQAQMLGDALGKVGGLINSVVSSPAIQLIGGLFGGLFGKTAPKFFADGGAFGAGDPFVMSENAPEYLNIGAGGYSIGSAAMVIPMQSGSVSRGGGGGTYTFYIQSNDVEGVRREVLNVMEQVMG